MVSEGKQRVQFRAPRGLIARADALATVLDTDRTDILTDALAEYLRDASHDDDLTQEIADAYYDDDIGFEQLQALVGHEEAANVRVLKDQLSDEFIDETAAELSNP
jgi:predicted transcriptional regulator